jgi:exoribonuclease-2
MSGSKKPYSDENLRALATIAPNERTPLPKWNVSLRSAPPRAVLVKRIGDVFDAVVSGVNEHGAWVRITRPLVEGKLLGDTRHLDVGNRLKVRLVSTDAENGFIDFEVA